MASRTGVTHYAWPGGLAMVIETPASAAAAVWRADGWRTGPVDEVFARPPSGAEVIHLALPESLAGELGELQLLGSSLHTDFVHLDRLVNRLAAEGTDAALFVLGRAPAALVLHGDRVTLVEPAPSAHEPLEEVLTGADGWIVVGLVSVAVSRVTPDASVRGSVSGPGSEPILTEQKPSSSQHADVGASSTEPPTAAPAPAPAPAPGPAPDAVSQVQAAVPAGRDSAGPAEYSWAGRDSAGSFGRFAGDARFILAHDASKRISAGASAKIAEAAGESTPAVLALFDGTHTLLQVSAATGLGPVAVASIVEILLAHRLVFRYVSRVRPPTSASTPG